MLKTKPLLKLAALATAAALSLTACSSGSQSAESASPRNSQDNVTFRAAFLPTANYLTTVRDTNILQDELEPIGAKAEFIGPLDPFEAYNTVTAGKADASSTGTGYFVNLAAQDSDWVAFALEKYSGNSQGIVAAPNSGVNSLKDLYGKKVGIDGEGATGDYLVNQAFAHEGLDVSKVEKVSLEQADFASAFASGQIDAIASFDQNLANAIATPGSKTLITGDKIGSYNWSIHIASKDFVQNHPEAIKAVYDGLVEEAARAKKDPSIITNAYKEFGASDQVIDVVKTFDVPQILPLDNQAVSDLNKLGQQYVDFKFIEKAPDIQNYVVDLSK